MNRAICMRCWTVMESKTRHDFVRCECQESFLDGGDVYSRAGGVAVGIPDHVMTEQQFLDHLDELDEEMNQQ